MTISSPWEGKEGNRKEANKMRRTHVFILYEEEIIRNRTVVSKISRALNLKMPVRNEHKICAFHCGPSGMLAGPGGGPQPPLHARQKTQHASVAAGFLAVTWCSRHKWLLKQPPLQSLVSNLSGK